MRLIKLWDASLDEAYDFFNAFQAEETGYVNACYGMTKEEFLEYRLLKKDNEQGLRLPEGFVPDTIYLLEDEGRYVATFNYRHYLNDFLRNGPGHIGYAVSKKYRGMGYATRGLKLLLETVDVPEDEFYLSCNKDNKKSLQVQLNCGGTIHHEDELHYYVRIKK